MTSHHGYTLHALPLEFNSVMHKTRKCIFKMRLFFNWYVLLYTQTHGHVHIVICSRANVVIYWMCNS